MKIKKTFLLKIGFLLLIGLYAFACRASETYTYSILHDNKPIGTIRCEKKQNRDTIEYQFVSQVNMRFIFSLQIEDRIRVSFTGQQLWKASVYRTVNGKVKVDNQTLRIGNQYQVKRAGDKPDWIPGPLAYSTVCLYFEEPLQKAKVFSEKFQQLISLKALGNSSYQLNLPNGRKTVYKYHKGQCQFVEADTEWARIRFVRLP